MLNKRIEKIAINILAEFNVTKLPIPLEEIIKKRGLVIKHQDLGEGISGVLLINKGNGVIGVNSSDPDVRKKFTIAHEYGHYELHRKNKELFIDKGFSALYRNQNSSTGEIVIEQEANAFAAAILMPENLIIKEMKTKKLDLAHEDTVRELANSFGVSSVAMSYRISNLNLYFKYGF